MNFVLVLLEKANGILMETIGMSVMVSIVFIRGEITSVCFYLSVIYQRMQIGEQTLVQQPEAQTSSRQHNRQMRD